MTVNSSKAKPKYRRPLNDEQLAVLRLLYRFRFGSGRYIADYLGKNTVKVVQHKLKILEDQGFISKRYTKDYKLAGRPAEYYLTPKGARALMARDDLQAKTSQRTTAQGIKNLYKNPTVSENFMQHCLTILRVAIHLQKLYGDKLQPFSRMQMLSYNYLPSWRPDLFLSLKTEPDNAPKRYFLDIWDGTRPFFVSVKKARSYLTYAEADDWPAEQDSPTILMLCDTPKNETKLRRQIRRALDEFYEEELLFATTTISSFMTTAGPKDKLWREVSDEDEVWTLTQLGS